MPVKWCWDASLGPLDLARFGIAPKLLSAARRQGAPKGGVLVLFGPMYGLAVGVVRSACKFFLGVAKNYISHRKLFS